MSFENLEIIWITLLNNGQSSTGSGTRDIIINKSMIGNAQLQINKIHAKIEFCVYQWNRSIQSRVFSMEFGEDEERKWKVKI